MVATKRRIYTLNGLPPEVVAVAFAKTSRSPEPFDRIARDLNEDASRKFHERWVVGYGHSSVAEHAVLSIAIENVSFLATKVLEDNRLASYTEKSTRYQAFNKESFYKPPAVMESRHGALFEATVHGIVDTYRDLTRKLHPYMDALLDNVAYEKPQVRKMRCSNMVLDNTRYLLPVAFLTNLGMTINARSLEHVIVKLLSHPLEEMQEIGEELREAGVEVTPTLIKYTKPNNYLMRCEAALFQHAEEQLSNAVSADDEDVRLVEAEENPEVNIIAALLYRFSSLSYTEVRDQVLRMTEAERERIFRSALDGRGRHDAPLRELEHAYFTFDILVDYGAFRDIQRHRMCTQTNQLLTTSHGYDVPEAIEAAGFESEFRSCMERAEETYKRIREDLPAEASYILPLAFRKRVLIKWNLRELYHFVELRSGITGHSSYRKIAQKIYLILKERHPLLTEYMRCCME